MSHPTNLDHRNTFNPRPHYHTGEPCVSSYTDRVEPDKGMIGQWYEVLAFSDYSGSCLDVANLVAFDAETPPLLTSYTLTQHGGHGTKALVMRSAILRLAQRDWTCDRRDVPDWLLDLHTACTYLADIVDGLSDYPVIDDEELSKAEEASAVSGWESWQGSDTIDDLTALLQKSATITIDTDKVDAGAVLAWLGKHADALNLHVEDEGHGCDNARYVWDERKLASLWNDEEALDLGWRLAPDELRANELLEDILEHRPEVMANHLEAIVGSVTPRDLARAIAGMPSLALDVILQALADCHLSA